MNEDDFEALCANVWDTTRGIPWSQANDEDELKSYTFGVETFRPDDLRDIVRSTLHFQGIGVSKREGGVA